ncbi:peptidoglycan-binding protein ArfA [bacterium BMS3Abin09]|nr:peptidoglycan-binding protein ArfA [bacterium BMS3Abin09]GBE40847.1 peptidoglycan-binding protein ArfA [bacterium BMS3Bbin09]HDN94749.1 OmpA family protein [Nitrospirota bacterium]HDO67311.1 OmpA family protein [Nitrospirota bacterium]HEW81485.1 OmpA family protein [Nitrospirota bacterium]
MRNFIIILSIVFFVLAGYIRFMESDIPAKAPAPINDTEEVMSNDISPEVEKIAREQTASQLQVKELQAMVANLEDKLSNRKEEPRKQIEPVKSTGPERVLAVLGGGSFLSGQIVISEDLMNTVNRIVPDILASPDQRLIIEGHTDNIPIRSSVGRGYKDNVELAFLRGKAVADILVKNNIPLERIYVISYGDTRPIASNETAEGRARNRRVEIKLVP